MAAEDLEALHEINEYLAGANERLGAQLRRANALLRRFSTCCGSGLDLDVLEDLYAYLDALDEDESHL